MKLFIVILVSVILLPSAIFAQTPSQSLSNTYLNENQYVQNSQGVDTGISERVFVVRFRHQQDTNYSFKLIYLDSSKNTLVGKRYYKSGLLDGPFEDYDNGALHAKGEYKMGKLHAEKLTYRNGIIVRRANFTDGKKSGIWQEYNQQGLLKKKITYDAFENIQSTETF